LQELAKELTVVAVSHQPALINAADTIYALAKGKAERVRYPSVIENDAHLATT
jgi:ATP-binding cassette subfamily C protein